MSRRSPTGSGTVTSTALPDSADHQIAHPKPVTNHIQIADSHVVRDQFPDPNMCQRGGLAVSHVSSTICQLLIAEYPPEGGGFKHRYG